MTIYHLLGFYAVMCIFPKFRALMSWLLSIVFSFLGLVVLVVAVVINLIAATLVNLGSFLRQGH